MLNNFPIILASASPARLELLKRIKIIPEQVIPANIDESEKKKELPDKLAERLAYEKGITISKKFDQAIIIAADTVAVVGRRPLPKALISDEIKYCLNKLSGRRHRIYTGLCIIKKDFNEIVIRRRVVMSTIKFKRLTPDEIEFYSTLDEGINKAGGYTLQGYAEAFISFLSGSYSNILGLPLFETRNILTSLGVHSSKSIVENELRKLEIH